MQDLLLNDGGQCGVARVSLDDVVKELLKHPLGLQQMLVTLTVFQVSDCKCFVGPVHPNLRVVV